MPEPNTHIAAGLGVSWLGAKLIGLDTDYLIVGMVGSLLAAAQAEPQPYHYPGHFLIGKTRQTLNAIANLCAVSFFAAAATSIGVLLFPVINGAAVAVAGLLGFFGHHVIQSITEFIRRFWRVGLKRMGGSDADADS